MPRKGDGISKKYILVSAIVAVVVLAIVAVVLQATTTVESGMTCNAGLVAPVYIRASSGSIPVMNLTVWNITYAGEGVDATNVTYVNITFTNVTWFDSSNLSALTAGTDSGVALYNDTNANGILDSGEGLAEYTDVPTSESVDSDGDGATDDWRVSFKNPDGMIAPGGLNRYNFIVVIRTSATIQNGTQFNLSIQAGQIAGWDMGVAGNAPRYSTTPSANIWKDLTITADTFIPEVTDPQVVYPVNRINALGQQYARRGDVVNLSCIVTDNLAGIEAVKINATYINSTAGWVTTTYDAGTGRYYANVEVSTAIDGLYDLYINATDKALDKNVDTPDIGNHNITEKITVRIDSQVANGTTEALTWDGHPFVRESAYYALFGFNATADLASTYNLTYVNVSFANVVSFSTLELKELSTNGALSGVSIWRDDGSGNDDVLDTAGADADTPLTINSIAWDGLICRMRVSWDTQIEYVPLSVTGKYQWFVVIYTNITMVDGVQFTASIPKDNIVFSDGTNQPPSEVATVTIRSDTVAPPTPEPKPEPLYTQGDRNNVSCNVSVDLDVTGATTNASGTKAYRFQCNVTTDFGAPFADSGWVTNPWYTFDNLANNITYYYRVAATDNVGHVSAWSSIINSTQDHYWADYPNTTIAIGEPKYSTEPTYINNTTPFNFTSTDNVSGVWKIEWSVKDSAGNIVAGPKHIELTTAPGTLMATTGDFTLAEYNLPDGHYNFSFRTYDWAYSNTTGYTTIPATPDDPNIEVNETKWIYIDNTPPAITSVAPTVTWVSPAGQNWTNGTWNNVTWSGSDGSGAGIKAYNASIDNEHPFIEWISTGHHSATIWMEGSGSYDTLEEPERWINWTIYWSEDGDNTTGWCNWTDLVSGVLYFFNVTAMDQLGQIGEYSYKVLKVNSTQDNDDPVEHELYDALDEKIGEPKYRATADDPYNVTTKPNEAYTAGTPIKIMVKDKPDPAGAPPFAIMHSGINRTWYYINELVSGNYSESAIGVDTITVDLSGRPQDLALTIYYGAIDNVTRNITLGSFTVWIDDSEPSVNYDIGYPAYPDANPVSGCNITKDTTIWINSSDNPIHAAGVKQTHWRITNATGYDSGWKTNDTLTYMQIAASVSFNFATLEAWLGTTFNDDLYTIYYAATDNLGNRSADFNIEVYLDTKAPTGNLLITGTPSYLDYYVNSTTVLTIWANNSAGVDWIWYIINTTYYEVDVGNAKNESITFTVSSTFAEVGHTITYGAKDTVGNNGTIGTKDIYLDNSPPALTEIKPHVDYHYGCQNWTKGLSNNVTFTASDVGSGLHPEPYWCQKGYDDAFSVSPENSGWIATAYFEWNSTNSQCVDGEKYYYRFRARDNLGQWNTTSGGMQTTTSQWSYIVNSTQDNSDPTLDAPWVKDPKYKAAADVYYNITRTTEIQINATDRLYNVSGVYKIWYIVTYGAYSKYHETIFTTQLTSASITFTLDVDYQADGWYTIQYGAEDNVIGVYESPPHGGNNNTSATLVYYVCIDTTPPTSSITSGANVWNTTNGTVNIVGTITDPTPGSGPMIAFLWYRHALNNNTTISGASWVNFGVNISGKFEWNFDFPAGEGVYQLYVNASDNLNNQNTTPPFEMAWIGLDTAPPYIESVTPVWQWNNTGTVTIYWTVQDNTSGLCNVTVFWCNSSDNGTTDDWSAWAAVSGIWHQYLNNIFGPDTQSFTFELPLGLPNETYYRFSISVEDWAGNSTDAYDVSKNVSVGYEKTKPASWVTSTSGDQHPETRWYYTNVIITLSAADYASITPLSGVKEIRYKVITNDIEPADYEVYNGSCIVLTDGRHKLKYWAVDNASNEEDPHIGPAIYVDTTPPNAYSLSLAGGVDYTNTIIVSCAIGVFENESAIMEWNISFNNWQTYRVLATGSLVIDLTLEPAGDGLKQVWVKVRDKGGWESVAVTDTITVDTVPPSLSNEAPTGYVTTTTAPTISITVTWDGAPVTQATCWMYIDGTSVAPTLVGNTLSYTPTGLSQGLHEVEVVVEDVAGNQQSKKWTFTIDTIPPVIGSPTPTPDSTVTTTTVTVSAVFTEETSGIDVTTIVMTINGAVVAHSYAPATGTVSYVLAIPVGTYATYTVIVNVKDKAGLAATPLNWSFIADTRLPDTTAPTTTPSVEPSVPATGWYITNVYVNLTATDPTVANAITSGVKEIRYQIVKDGTPGAVVIVSGNVAHIVLSEGGKYIVKYWAVDNANNEELESSTPEIKIDKTAPTGTILINADATYTTTTAVTLTVSATDAGSGVSQMCFSNDNIIYTAWESYGTSKLWTLTTGDETKTVYVKFKDVAGLESTAFSDTIILDTTAPTGTISINADATYTTSTAVTLTLTASDANGVASICFSNDGTTYTGWETISTMKSWVLTAGDETKTVYVKFKDVAGIESGAFRDTIILDTTKPIGNVSINAGAIYTKTTAVTLTLSASDANGVATMCFSNDGVMYSSPETYNTTKLWTLSAGDGTKFVYVKFIDSAGNEIVVTDDIILDATRPAVSIVGGDRTVRYAEKKITFTAVVSDDVITYEWRIVDEADRELKTSIDPSVTYEFPDRGGTYTVTLTVTDKAGNTNTATVTIIVRPKPTPPFIPGFEALALIAALAVVAIVAVKSRKKKQ